MSRYKRLEELKKMLSSSTPIPAPAPKVEAVEPESRMDWQAELEKDQKELASMTADQSRLDELEDEIELDKEKIEELEG